MLPSVSTKLLAVVVGRVRRVCGFLLVLLLFSLRYYSGELALTQNLFVKLCISLFYVFLGLFFRTAQIVRSACSSIALHATRFILEPYRPLL